MDDFVSAQRRVLLRWLDEADAEHVRALRAVNALKPTAFGTHAEYIRALHRARRDAVAAECKALSLTVRLDELEASDA